MPVVRHLLTLIYSSVTFSQLEKMLAIDPAALQDTLQLAHQLDVCEVLERAEQFLVAKAQLRVLWRTTAQAVGWAVLASTTGLTAPRQECEEVLMRRAVSMVSLPEACDLPPDSLLRIFQGTLQLVQSAEVSGILRPGDLEMMLTEGQLPEADVVGEDGEGHGYGDGGDVW